MEGRQRCLACYFKIFFPFYLNVFVTFLLKKFDVVLLQFDLFIILLNPFLASCSFNLCLVIYIHSMKIQGHISRSLWGKLEIKVWSCRHMVSVLFFIFLLLLLFFKIVYAGYTFVYLITYLIELEGMNTVLSMIWLLMLSRVKEVMSGHARTMMVTCRVIS